MLRRLGIVVLVGLGLATLAWGVVTWLYVAATSDWSSRELVQIASWSMWPVWAFAAICLGGALLLARHDRARSGLPLYSPSTAHVGPAQISLILGVETGDSGRSHYCRVHGREAAESLASFLRSQGIPVILRRAGGEKRIIHFPESRSSDDARADRKRYQDLVARFRT